MSASMNPLLLQFIPEARELLEEAGRSLLALERTPGGEAMNALFRAVHTVKGTSGLFEIEPLTRVAHAAEDLLDEVQSGRMALGAEMADVLLESLDEIGLWIDSLEQSGELPPGAEAIAGTRVARLRAPLAVHRTPAAADAQSLVQNAQATWIQELAGPARQPGSNEAGSALLAVSYAPDEHCFFRGEDPLGLMRQIPGLRLLRADPVAPWPTLDQIDPFVCNLRFRAITAAPMSEVEHLLRYVRDQVEIIALPPGWPGAETTELAADDGIAQALLEGQRRLLEVSGSEDLWPGRLAAASRALRGVLRYAGRDDLLDLLEARTDAALTSGEPEPLLALIRTIAASSPAALPGNIAPDEITSADAGSKASPQDSVRGTASAVAPAMLRVEQGKVDTLMNLIGELVVAKNALAYLAKRAEEGSLTVRELSREIKDRHALVNRISEDMQSALMAIRMLPVDHVFQRFPRLVRDIARRLGKHVELVVEGGDTAADKNIIEALADPLIHIVRNSLDHGIEPPEMRTRADKPIHGTIRLKASQDNDSVVIRVTDDGRGIDPDAVRRKAIEKGLIDPERAAALTDEEAVMLVFTPSFSTASEVSDLSGRGVGMDVVRSAVEKVGGRVTLSSRAGQGTTVELVMPLSMAISRIMTVSCGGKLFGVPMALVAETVRVPRRGLHRFRDREAFVLRDSVVPVVRLARLLDLTLEGDDSEEEAILVVRMNGERLGIVVGGFREGMEVIVKPMEGVLAGLRGFAGTTLLGDGRVLLILDLRELVN
jgi:two-component system chemotaxis sensor kinase CheA